MSTPRITDVAFRFSSLDVARTFAERQSAPARVVYVPDEQPYAHYWVVSPEDAQTLESRGYAILWPIPLTPDLG